ncbi:MAG TPA: GNAT family N-acetyltransferase [Bacilli bacterium]|nr:MAG: Acetyltransferase (GNAT) family protein [Tenericutes bacterium ADurb.BinA124]HNZ50569.1 GNAT family N-acetyltransferase [Bacilli bacterium]HPX84218.1 GNAT family N-acetyltransferase [Bacilli bacterium]HQC74450.1 GNAT family N-acetyltransferase [Bacilli bacterium]
MYFINNLLNPQLVWEEALTLWNCEMGRIFPLSPAVFKQNIRDCPEINKSASGLAFDENGLIGFLFAKEFNHEGIKKYQTLGFVSFFYISKKHRNQGVGSKLLEMCEQVFKQRAKTEIVIGRDYHNLFPGVPGDFNNLTGPWLEKRQYQYRRTTHDLINWQPEAHYPLLNHRYEFRLATVKDYEKMISFFERNFPGRWQFEYEEFMTKTPTDQAYLVALDGSQIIAFTRVNDRRLRLIPYNMTWAERFTNLGAIGPLGVDKDYRQQHLGYDIVCAGLNELGRRGCQPIMVDWTGLLEFYQQFGFEVWKTYNYYAKQFE